jgi:hypothetical protein
MSHKDAMAHFREFTNSTQQSPDPFELPVGAASKDPITHLLTIFTQAGLQYHNAEMRVFYNRKTMPKTEMAKRLFTYHVLLPTIWQFAASGFQWNNPDQIRAAIVGPLGYVWILGDGLKNIVGLVVAMMMKTKKPQMQTKSDLLETQLKATYEALKGIEQLVFKGGLTAEEAFGFIEDLAVAVGPYTGAMSGGVRYTAGVIKGGMAMSHGEYAYTMRKIMGFSDNAAKNK